MNGTGDLRHDLFQQAQSRWLKPAEVFFILQNHDSNLISHKAPQSPTSGSLFLFDRKILPSFRKDGHNWQKKKGRNSALESHVQLTVDNAKTLDCYYAHGEENGNFQRRSYWMLNEDYKHIVLVHYRDITQPQGDRSPASGSGQCYNLSQSDTFVPLERQGTASLIGSNQSLCSLGSEQQWIEVGDNLNGFASVGPSQQDDVNLLRQAVESIPFDTQKQDTDGTANSAILGNYNFTRELVEGSTLPENRYFGSDDGMLSDSTALTPIWEEIGSLFAPQEAEELDLASCLGITATSFIPDPGQMQMELVDSTQTLVSKHKFTIREMSPQWGFADEATKVIIVGSFHCDTSKMAWACMFGDTEVQIEIIQDGVICCEAPPRHSAGKVTVCITSGNQESCSEAIGFEYRDRNSTCDNCIRPQQEENKSMEEVKLLVRFADMLLPNSSLQKEECSNFSMHPTTEALQTGCGTSTGIIDQVLQELLKDKLLQWLSARFMKDGGDMNCTLSKKEQGIIHIAAALGYEWALNPLLNCGVVVNFRDTKGWTALHWAAQFGRESMVVALTNSGACARAVTDPTAQEPKGRNPASIAYANGHKGLAGYLSELAMTTHIQSLTLEEVSGVDLEAIDVSNISAPGVTSAEDQHSVEQVLAAGKTTARAARFIQAVFRAHSFRKRRQRENAKHSSVDEYGLTSHEMQLFSSASKAVLPHSHHHNVDALPIQKSSRCGKDRKRFFKMRKVVKIQPQIRGFRGTKCYKVLWPVSIMEKVVLRWLRKGPGLRGYKPNREVSEEDEDILKDIRKQIVDTLFNEALRVQSMVHCPQARNQYTRMREASQQAKDKSDVFTIEEVEASLAGMVFADNDTDNALIQLPLEPTPDSPGYCGLWTQSVC